MDLNDFISNVGGALGLFLGFSIIETMYPLYEFLFKLCERNSNAVADTGNGGKNPGAVFDKIFEIKHG